MHFVQALYFHLYVFPSHLVQNAKTEFLLMKTQRVFSCQCANARYRKNQGFLYFIINSNSKLKKIQHGILDRYSKKGSLRNLTSFHGGLFELEILEIFTTAFLLKAIF